MEAVVRKWGNSLGIRIPKAFLQDIQITENDPVDVLLEKEKIVIKKRSARKHKTTRERIKEFYGTEFFEKLTPQEEIDWGKPVGKEIW